MNLMNYETLMLARTEITDDELNALERQIDNMVAAKKGKMTLFDRWGKYKLAYPVKKNIYGVYILARYQVPAKDVEAFFKEIDSLFRIKYNELVMRHVTVKLAEDVSSVYKYPDPIGTRGNSNLDSFIKENKMKGLIDTPVGEKKEEKAPDETPEEVKEEEPKVEETAPKDEPVAETEKPADDVEAPEEPSEEEK